MLLVGSLRLALTGGLVQADEELVVAHSKNLKQQRWTRSSPPSQRTENRPVPHATRTHSPFMYIRYPFIYSVSNTYPVGQVSMQ